MNFKLTLWKSAVSVIVLIVSDYFLVTKILYVINLRQHSIFELMWGDLIVQLMLQPLSIGVALVITIIIYIIWSLFQKKKR